MFFRHLCNTEATKSIERRMMREQIYKDFLAMLRLIPKGKYSEMGFERPLREHKHVSCSRRQGHEVCKGGWR